MRRVRKITKDEKDSRVVPVRGMEDAITIRQDSIEPEPIGTIVLIPFRITGYTKDCDGSAIAQLEEIDLNGESSGWNPDCSLCHESHLVVTIEELRRLLDSA